jgi:hypothetical protein
VIGERPRTFCERDIPEPRAADGTSTGHSHLRAETVPDTNEASSTRLVRELADRSPFQTTPVHPKYARGDLIVQLIAGSLPHGSDDLVDLRSQSLSDDNSGEVPCRLHHVV